MRNCALFISFFLGPVSRTMVWTKISAPSLVTGSLGTSITVRCHYSPLYKNHTKYWCEGVIYELCKIVVKTTKPRRWGRASIRDDTQNGFFTVTTSALRWSDKGKYWCVIARPGRNVFTGVFLEIVKAGNLSHLSALLMSRVSCSDLGRRMIP
uniref:Immunoglobulin domain-containing protein n=1 Tax=Scleropages formosus TaxID=113540 RepID=A0A8C9W4M1_SCLFO